MKNTGSNTLGYGKTKEVVIAGFKAGMTMTEIAKKHGLSRTAVNNCAYRNGFKFPYVKMRQPYGDLKYNVMVAAEEGLTQKQITQKYGYKPRSVYNIIRDYKLRISKA